MGVTGEGDGGGLIGGGKVGWDLGGALAFSGGGPLGATLQGLVKTAAEHGVVGVAEGGVKDAAFAVLQDHQIGLVLVGEIGGGGGEDLDVFCRASQAGVKFVTGVQPAWW